MSGSNERLRDPTSTSIVSSSPEDLLIPGVVVELDASEADDIGAFEENALTEAEAWEANADLDMSEVGDGA
jgi:hypothetical protein